MHISNTSPASFMVVFDYSSKDYGIDILVSSIGR